MMFLANTELQIRPDATEMVWGAVSVLIAVALVGLAVGAAVRAFRTSRRG